jgi:hypothetical protein
MDIYRVDPVIERLLDVLALLPSHSEGYFFSFGLPTEYQLGISVPLLNLFA